jgi:ABC-type branched-subunit amino acid transport system ATPase component/ABC-type branched-subunit amino acid transport system permease subunit
MTATAEAATGAPATNQAAPPLNATVLTRWRAVATPYRANAVLLLLAAILGPTLTAREMPAWFGQDWALALAGAAGLAIAAIALNLLTGYAGQISLGHGALLAVGAFAAGLVTSRAHLPMWVGLPVAGVVAGVVALIIGFPALRLRGLYLAVVTIAFGYAMYNSVLRLNLFTGGSAGVELTRRLWGKVTVVDQAQMLAGALVVLVLAWLLDSNVTRTRLGRALRAIRESEPVAQSFGIDVARYKLLAFVLSGALAGVAGAVIGFTVYLVNSETFFPSVGVDYSLILVIVVVVGGLGSRAGAVIASFVLSLFPFVVGKYLGDSSPLYGLAPIIGAALLIYAVARHPGGFAGAIGELREKRRRRVLSADDEEPPVRALPQMPRSAAMARAADPSVPVLEVEEVTVRFGGLVAVDGASLQVRQGQVVGLIGPNGAGKTTLFNAVSGLIRPAAGRVRLLGSDVSGLPAHERAGLGLSRTFQQIGLSKDQTVLENMLLAQHVLSGYGSGAALLYTHRVGVSEAEMKDRAMEAISALGFDGREDVPVRLLSGGQQRIVEVACALLTEPQLLMLDEPSAGMSPAAAESLADRLLDLRRTPGRTVLLIEHNVPLVLDVCDYVYVLNFGKVLASGTPEEILAHPDVVSAYLGEAVVA